ncbi:MAG: hypothetical protein FWE16_00270 [Firmicutes bacterium]|nr:hypothetical protein [Bacillota bacterium]
MNLIANKILEDANAAHAKKIKNAQSIAQTQIKNTMKELEESQSKAMEQAKKRKEHEVKQRELVQKTITNRENLTNMQSTINDVFMAAKEKLLVQSNAETQKFVSALLRKHAKSGDTIIVSKNDEGKLDNKFFTSFAIKNLKREVSSKFQGGIIIENTDYTLSLTLDDILAELRTCIELNVSEILF